MSSLRTPRRRQAAERASTASARSPASMSMPPTSRCPACCSARSCAAARRMPASCGSMSPRRWRCRACAAILTAPGHPADPFRHGDQGPDRCSPTDGVRFRGEAIAAVAATSLEIAEAAVRAIEIEYEPLPAVFDPEEALLPGAPLVHAGWSDYQALPVFDREGNISGRSAIGGGDVEAGFAQSYRVYEHRFTTQHVHPGYTEPRAAVASWDGNGDVIVWSQHPASVRHEEHAGRGARPAGQQGARHRARHRRRLRRQAARRRRALRGVAGAQVAAGRSR